VKVDDESKFNVDEKFPTTNFSVEFTHLRMFSTAKTFISAEIKRLVKYTVVGTAIGAGVAGGGGHLIMQTFKSTAEIELREKMTGVIPNIIQVPSLFIFDKILDRVKREGVEVCVFYGGWYGLFAGISLGFTRVSIGVAVKILKQAANLAFKTQK
jgi:hypothetical protein